MNAKLSNFHTKSCFPWLYFSFLCSHTFSAHILIFVCLCCFSFRSFPHSALAFPNVAVRVSCKSAQAQVSSLVHQFLIGSSSSANQSKRGSDVTPTCLISCRCSASLVQVKMDYCQLGNIFPYRTPLYVAICHYCTSTW